MSRDNLKGKFLGEILNYELKQHDWTYEMSDDHGVWRRGTEEEKRIRAMVKAAYAEGCDPADLFYEYYPKDGCDPGSAYGIRRTWEEQLDKKAMAFGKK